MIVYVLVQEGQARPAGVVTEDKEQEAHTWANKASNRDIFAFELDDVSLLPIGFDRPGDSNYGKDDEDVGL